MKSMVRIGALFAALVLCSPAYAGDEFWVKAGASGNGKAKDTPAGTIIPLLQAARRGDVIHVAQGEYYGRDLKGEFAVDVPDLTLVGGYNDDFSERNPFKYPTVLKRKKGVRASYTEVLDGLVGTNPQAHAMGQKTGCSGFILDGFFLDATTRNVYAGPGPRLGQQGSWKAPLLKMITADFEQTRDIKIRNCVFVNNYYQGVLVKYWGEHNEVTNCLFVNCSIAGVDGSGAQAGKTAPTTKLHVKNSTFACFYSHDKATQAKGVNGGSQGKFLIENNVFAYLSGPQGPGVAAKGDNVTVRNNVFWFTNDIDKIIRDQKSAATGAGGRDDEEEEEEEEEEETSGGGEGGYSGNVKADPGFECDKDFLRTLLTFGAIYAKWPDSMVNEHAAKVIPGWENKKTGGNTGGPEWVAYMRPYPTDDYAAIPKAFASKIKNAGIQLDAKFESYKPRECKLEGFATGKKDEYQKVTWEDLMNASKLKSLDGKKVKFKAGLAARKELWHLEKDGIGFREYAAFELRMPGKTSENLSEKMMAYTVIGSAANERFNAYGNRLKRKKSWKEGTWVRGILHAKGFGKVKASIVVDYIGKVK